MRCISGFVDAMVELKANARYKESENFISKLGLVMEMTGHGQERYVGDVQFLQTLFEEGLHGIRIT